MSKAECRRIAFPFLERMGLADRSQYFPSMLSGGQKQRVAIARALVGKPQIIFADEPTGNLDIASTNNILNLLDEVNRENNVSIVVVTHDINISQRYEKQIVVNNGIVEILDNRPRLS